MQRDSSTRVVYYSSSKRRDWVEPRERRSLAFLGAKNGWMVGLLNHPGGLRNANFGCQLGTSQEEERCANKTSIVERRSARKGRDAFFAAHLSLPPSFPPSFPTKSHPRLNFGFASRSRCENVAFVSTFRSNFSLARWIS